MLGEHPLSRLSCYEKPPARRLAPLTATALGGAALLSLGLIPFDTLHASPALWALWIVATGAATTITGWLTVGTRAAGHLAAAFVMAGVLAWLLAPLLGVTGWLLRIPVLRGLAAGVGGYLVGLRPHHFPVVKAPRERAYCGVRV
jgi:hypothetical protein